MRELAMLQRAFRRAVLGADDEGLDARVQVPGGAAAARRYRRAASR